MSSYTRLTCPVTGRHTRIPFSSATDGAFVVVEPDDDDAIMLPVGWGRIVLEVAVSNPEIETVVAQRDLEVSNALEELRQSLAQEGLSKTQRDHRQTALDLGTAERDIKAAVEERYPMPDDLVVTARATFPVLSMEALRQAVEVLAKSGFPFLDPEGVAKELVK